MDLLIVAGRRPDLIERTLRSVEQNFLFTFSNVIVNLDPWASDNMDDHNRCKEIILEYCDKAVINEPAIPGFCQAVKYLWSNVKSDYALHLEDDWVWSRKFTEEELISKIGKHCMLRFRTRENRGIAAYGTSPAIITKHFAHEASNAFNVELDPEKQFGVNVDLQRAVSTHGGVTITKNIDCVDIGREWRSRRNISKVMVKPGVFEWIKS